MSDEQIRERDEAAVIAAGLHAPWAEAVAQDTPSGRMAAGLIAAVALYLVESGHVASYP